MKKIFVFCVFMILSISPILSKDKKEEIIFPKNDAGKIVYTEVVEMPNVTKDALYSRAYEWFTKANPKNVIQMQDKESGKIVGEGQWDAYEIKWNIMGMRSGVPGSIHFTISIYLKDGKYKYEITNFRHEGFYVHGTDRLICNGGLLEAEVPDNHGTISQKNWLHIKEKTHADAINFIESLKKAMTIESAGNNW